MARIQKIRFTGSYASRSAAATSLNSPGDTALIQKDVLRMLLMNCPCGCGDTLVMNLDSRAGSAWRLYRRKSLISLFPSYWRDTKCESHFILWKNCIFWCDWEDDSTWVDTNEIEERVLHGLTDRFINYDVLAEKLQEVPWDVLQACHALVRKGHAIMNLPRRTGEFRRIDRKEQ
jgi:hypothetical protein